MKHRYKWSPLETDECEAVYAEAWESSDRQSERTDALMAKLNGAVQAQRSWAVEELDTLSRIGGASRLKSWMKAQASVMITHDGRIFAKPKTVGVTRLDDEGAPYSEQTLFDWMTVEELRAKAREAVKVARSWSASVEMFYQLIGMCEAAGANTPAEAAIKLGTTVEAWLDPASERVA
jgi:hypothetical protein